MIDKTAELTRFLASILFYGILNLLIMAGAAALLGRFKRSLIRWTILLGLLCWLGLLTYYALQYWAVVGLFHK